MEAEDQMPGPDVPPLTDDQIAELDAAVATWAERHPHPDFEAFAFAGARPFSPRELSQALHTRDGEIAETFFLMTRYAMEVQDFARIVASFRSVPNGGGQGVVLS